ncbi:MAG: LysM peptidoglycan-binding domain-containing protein [Planctomycetes bacterium]|nr:LysM peptidoglycan-binding domain-containing protein [Planctomycetota bacterium]
MRTDVKIGIVAVAVVVVLVIVYFAVGHRPAKTVSENGVVSSTPRALAPPTNIPALPPTGSPLASNPEAPVGGVITPPAAESPAGGAAGIGTAPAPVVTLLPGSPNTSAAISRSAGGNSSPTREPPAATMRTGASVGAANVPSPAMANKPAVVAQTPVLPAAAAPASYNAVTSVAPRARTSHRYVMRRSPEGYFYVALRADNTAATGSLQHGTRAVTTSGTYIVRRGDTLNAIARRYCGSASATAAIERLNPGLNPRRLRIGQRLRLPGRTTGTSGHLAVVTSARGATPAGARSYTVRRGDDLRKIAVRFYHQASRWTAIYRANRRVIGANPSRLRIGERLIIPAP